MLLYAATLLALGGAAQVAAACRVLSVVTNVDSWVPTTGPKEFIGKPKPTGYWLSEFTHSYKVFKDAGCNVTVASPKGGKGAVDPQGYAFYANDPDTQLYVKTDAKTKQSSVPLTESTVPLAKINPADYDIVFFVGGTGAMWDFNAAARGSRDIDRIVRTMWETGKVVSAVCHGPIALTGVTLSNGKKLVDGKLLTSFSNTEEEKLGRANVCALCDYTPGCDPKTCDGPFMPAEYPKQGTYLIESRLKQQGAIYVSTAQDWDTYYFRPHVVRDGRLVTGQNPGAARETAQAVLETYRLNRAWKEGANAQLLDTLCTPIQQRPKDPPVKCSTTGPTPRPAQRAFTA